MIKQLLNSDIAKYRDWQCLADQLIICFSFRLRQIIDLLATDKSRYFAQPRPIIANYFAGIVSKLGPFFQVSIHAHPFLLSRAKYELK